MDHILNYVWAILSSILTSAAVAAAILWLAKTWMTERIKQSIQYEYNTKLELHKATFKAEFDVRVSEYQAAIALENSKVLEQVKADLAIEAARHKAAQDTLLAERQASLAAKNAETVERLKTDLQVAAAQRQLLHKTLHEREVEAIAETYENLSEELSVCRAYVSIFETHAMGTKAERRQALGVAAKKFRSRFRVQRLYLPRSLADSVQGFEQELFGRALKFASRVEPDHHSRDASEMWMAIDEFMDTEAKAMFDQLEGEFRRRLGQDEPSSVTKVHRGDGAAQQAAGA